jgi:hypothetical protein
VIGEIYKALSQWYQYNWKIRQTLSQGHYNDWGKILKTLSEGHQYE